MRFTSHVDQCYVSYHQPVLGEMYHRLVDIFRLVPQNFVSQTLFWITALPVQNLILKLCLPHVSKLILLVGTSGMQMLLCFSSY